jgi:phosphoribosyl 1,2-cyclic phosphodiesterase
MSLYIASLNSGSNGNCYYVGNETEAVFVDAGIPCKEIETRMKRLSLPIEKVKAVFVSHEHSDHISGIPTLVKKYKIPVYITTGTLRSRKLYIDKPLLRSFVSDETVAIGGLQVKSFFKAHDASDPHSFTISGNGVTIGVFTDIGAPCDNLAAHFRQCHAAFLESNYDEQMLQNGRYPYFLKSRITNGKGHLSNTQALDVFARHRPPFMSHLLLSHLSQDNNSPELVMNLFSNIAGHTKIIVASRERETPVYYICGENSGDNMAPREVHGREFQLSLFS